MTDLITEARELYNGWMAYEIMRHGGGPGAKSDDGEASKKFMMWLADEFPAMCDALEKAERESGCKWCKTPSYNPDIGGCTLVFYKSKTHPIGAYAISVSVFDEYGEEQEPVLVRIDNCIHCGKRLEVEHI